MKLPSKKPALTPERVRELLAVRDQYRAMPTVKEIGRRFGISETAVREYWRDPYRKNHHERAE